MVPLGGAVTDQIAVRAPVVVAVVLVLAALAATAWSERHRGLDALVWAQRRALRVSAVAGAVFAMLVFLGGSALWSLIVAWTITAALGFRAIPAFIGVAGLVLALAFAIEPAPNPPGFDAIGTEDVAGLALLVAVGGMVVIAIVRAALLVTLKGTRDTSSAR